MNSSRRYFLKVAGLSTFALAAGAARAEAATASYEAYPEGLKAKRWAMVIDTRRIQTVEDMRPIVEACHKAHNVPTIPGKHEVKWIWDDTFEHAFANDPTPMLPERHRRTVVFSCCATTAPIPPACASAPSGATYKTGDGLVAHRLSPLRGLPFLHGRLSLTVRRSFNFQDPASLHQRT